MGDWRDMVYSPERGMFGGWKPDGTLIYSTDGVNWSEGRKLTPAEIDRFKIYPSLVWAEIKKDKER